mmetsp:Transcript_5606/g.16223  ORF Transcript_5606/g.16223 Transcript_5606/m.16223 type:complete len:226 (+) Transcript_5606:1006-1683(+)
MESWKATIPLAISWKARDRIGGGMLRTPLCMFRTIKSWIHSNSSSTLASEVRSVSRLSASMPWGSISSYVKAVMSSSWPELLRSSRSASAEAWSMLKSRTSVCLKYKICSRSALECSQKATMALHASNHSARIVCVLVHPSQKRLYAWDVLKTMRKPTKKLNPLQACVSLSMLYSPCMKVMWPSLMSHRIPAATSPHGKAVAHEAGKTLPFIWKSFSKYHMPPLV